eukprot:CAMPEP_0170504200 /NCGR_PEP_ID=MMETSP0208-20121228/47201_1 /TAXON_ID=197538 /ORGANISM="Strombidium inclinatum, Strain S3" /LENGTH=36 /DNA_ID= /DNA_START= /DNA_END= /DNA_ORIENTATION=
MANIQKPPSRCSSGKGKRMAPGGKRGPLPPGMSTGY